MAVRSARLWSTVPIVAGTGFQVVATVPADERWILKELTFAIPGTGEANTVVDTFSGPAIFRQTMAAGAVHVFPRWTILSEGAVVRVNQLVGPDVRVTASGTRLVL